MVSLQLKEKDMQAQTATIDSLKQKLDEKDNEITQLES
jgi:predicted RNase H-like nuclease (RuvC/YqgF family)